MCFSYAWHYKCGCIAPKLVDNPNRRCTSWESGTSCEPQQLFSYLDVNCNEQCRWITSGDEKYRPGRQEDWYLYNGPYEGTPSEEDYYLNRVPNKLTEPFLVRNPGHRPRTAVPERSFRAANEQEVVTRDSGRVVESSDSEDSGVADLDSDIVVDESKPEEYVSNANFGGRRPIRRRINWSWSP